MKSPLNRTELTGLFLLAAIVVGITMCAVLMRGCGSSGNPEPKFEVIALDTVPVPVSTVSLDKPDVKEGRTSRKKGETKTRAGKSKTATPKKGAFRRSDPFSDTIPH